MAASARAALRTGRSGPMTGGRASHQPEPAPEDPALPEGSHAAFLAGLAHDLRTPLNAMVGWLHLLTAGTVSEDLRERALAGLQRAVEQQRRVVATLDAPNDFADGYRPEPAGDKVGTNPVSPTSRRGEAPVRRSRRPTNDLAHGTAAKKTAVAEVDASPAAGILQGVFIFAVDDDPDVLQMLQSLLEHSGAIVESTTSPDEALRRYASWASGEGDRLVLSDLAMHERDGISLMQAVRALERDLNLRRLPAIALSAHFRPDTRREAFEGGFDLFLAKPIDPSVLLNHLRSMLDR